MSSIAGRRLSRLAWGMLSLRVCLLGSPEALAGEPPARSLSLGKAGGMPQAPAASFSEFSDGTGEEPLRSATPLPRGGKEGSPTRDGWERRESRSTIDFSRQVIVLGERADRRSRFVSAAHRMREQALGLLHQAPARYPVARPLLIVLHGGAEANRKTSSAPMVIEDPAGLKFQIEISELENPEGPRFRRLFVTALLLELGYRKSPGHPPESPPRWLVDGLLLALFAESPWEHSERLRPLLEEGRFPSLEALLVRPESDPRPSTAPEEAASRSLLHLLREKPEARTGFWNLLGAEWRAEGATSGLLRLFPSLGQSEAELQRLWTLYLASQATQKDRVQLDGFQTESALRKLLQVCLLGPEGNARAYSLEQFSEFVRMPGVKEVLAARHLEFSALMGRAHADFSEPLAIYAEVCRQLSLGVTRGQAERLRRGRDLLEGAAQQLEKTRDRLTREEWERAEAAVLEEAARRASQTARPRGDSVGTAPVPQEIPARR